MQIKPMIRNNICLNSHPRGCQKMVQDQVAYVKKHLTTGEGTPKLVLVLGCSTGYGLASRIAASFGYGAATVGLSFEKPGTATKCGTPGFYDNQAFEIEARKAGIASKTLDGDAYSNEMKAATIEAIKEVAKAAGIEAKIDLVVYSLASPVRTDPRDGVMYRSVIKPIGAPFSGKTMDMLTGKISMMSAEPASPEEIANTVKVMGGEDWELWIDALESAGVLAPTARTVAYTYLGPELSWAIYKNGTIGQAKVNLEATGLKLNKRLSKSGGAAWVSVNKALVTRSSSVIPIIPLYISSLFKVMKGMGLHEGCVEQITRLYKERLYTKEAAQDATRVAVDESNRIRIDDWEMRADVQKATEERMASITEENLAELSDLAGYRHDFLEAHGFDVAGVDYDAEVDPSGL